MKRLKNTMSINCGECNQLKQCFECKNITPYNIRVGENDNNPVICSAIAKAPEDSYYSTNTSDNKTYYYKCIDNCKIYKNWETFYQCHPEYYLNKSLQCVETFEGY